jgi:hypothetical protein
LLVQLLATAVNQKDVFHVCNYHHLLQTGEKVSDMRSFGWPALVSSMIDQAKIKASKQSAEETKDGHSSCGSSAASHLLLPLASLPCFLPAALESSPDQEGGNEILLLLQGDWGLF